MSTEFDISQHFQYEHWYPQGLPQDAYLDAAFYKVPRNLYWRVLERNFSLTRQPISDQELLIIPFHTARDNPQDFARQQGTALLIVYLKEVGAQTNWVSDFNHLEIMIGDYREGTTKVLTFSDGYEEFIRKKVDQKLLNGVEFYRFRQTEYDHLDPNIVLVFSSLGKIVTGGSCYGYGIALKEYELRMCRLPVVPKTRYARVLEGNVS